VAPASGLIGGLMLIAVTAATAAGAAPPPIATGTVPPDWPAGTSAAVAVPCPPGFKPSERMFAQIELDTHPRPILAPAQFEAADKTTGTPDRIWFNLTLDQKDRGRPVVIRVISNRKPIADRYQTRREGEQLHIATPDGKTVLSYWYGKPATGQRYPLTDFIHPLVGLDGETLTDRSPKDHPHHRGIFWAWVRHERNGKSLGTWWMPNTINAEERDLAFGDGPVFSHFSARHEWVYRAKGAEETMPFVSEQVVCRTFEATPHGRAIDVDLTLTAIVDGIRMGGTTDLNKGYGGFTFRYGPATGAQIVADGKPIPKDLNHLRARWADWTGRFKPPGGGNADRRSGAAIFVAPDHPDAPPEWITRLYGVLNVSYPGLNMIDLPKGKPLRLHYRLWVHRGDTGEGQVDEQYRAYAADWKWTPARDAKKDGARQDGAIER
jgi:hypothetical protein